MERMDFTASINHSALRRKLTGGKCMLRNMLQQNGITLFPKSKKIPDTTGEQIHKKESPGKHGSLQR